MKLWRQSESVQVHRVNGNVVACVEFERSKMRNCPLCVRDSGNVEELFPPVIRARFEQLTCKA